MGRGQQWLKQGKGIEVDIATPMTFPDSDPDRTRILGHGHGHGGGGVLVVIHRLSLSLMSAYTHLALTVVLRPNYLPYYLLPDYRTFTTNCNSSLAHYSHSMLDTHQPSLPKISSATRTSNSSNPNSMYPARAKDNCVER